MDDVLVSLGIAVVVVYIPTESFEERIEKFPAELRLVVLARLVRIKLLLEAGDEFQDFPGRGHCVRLGKRKSPVNAALDENSEGI